jgi:hypothetical protein
VARHELLGERGPLLLQCWIGAVWYAAPLPKSASKPRAIDALTQTLSVLSESTLETSSQYCERAGAVATPSNFAPIQPRQDQPSEL